MSSETSTTAKPEAPPEEGKTDQNDLYSLKVKAEFVLPNVRSEEVPAATSSGVEKPIGDERNDASGSRKKRNKKGLNKKRPRDNRQDDSEKVCLAVVKGKECPYGEKCRFSHDMKGFMATRPTDIAEVESGCPLYNLYGYCVYGATCRFGSVHISKTGENLCKEGVTFSELPSEATGLSLQIPKEVQSQLRKKTFPFKCKRFFEKQDDNKASESAKAETPAQASIASSSTPVELKTRKIIDFSNKVYVAPLTTVGNLPFRRIMKRFGADITCGEMAVGTCLLEGKPSEWALLKRHSSEDIFGIQIAAAHADQFTRVSELIEQYAEADFVDFNLGCPLDLLCNKGAGAALMMRDRKLKGALEGATSVLSCPVTVKIRTGWDIHKPFAHQLVPKIQSWNIDGLAAMMLHGRSRLQRYQKLANWDYIGEVAQSLTDEYRRFPIIGNGDIFSYTDYEEKIARESVSKTAMLGRGALIKPWLPTEIKERRHWDISASERLDILKEFVKFGLEHWGSDQQGVNNTRRFLLEWLSFLHRYVPVGLLEVVPQQMNQRPPPRMCGRSDLETLFLSPDSSDWIKISEMLLGPVPDGFQFQPKHKANGYTQGEG
eukprot:Nitzschia sp. Nitz4//scaffold3_size479765//350476//352351//NITZ4_000146-RA/size479765-processed-gene-1.480-mRNA-1//1//CDS//3329550896//4375//frame0